VYSFSRIFQMHVLTHSICVEVSDYMSWRKYMTPSRVKRIAKSQIWTIKPTNIRASVCNN